MSDGIFAVGHGSVLEVHLDPKVKLNERGAGYLSLKASKPPALHFRKDAENGMHSYSLIPFVEFGSEPNKVLIQKIDDKIYDFTCPNQKIVEVSFDKDCSQDTLQKFDEYLLTLGLAKKKEIEVDPKNKMNSLAKIIDKGGLILSSGIDMASFWAGKGIRSSGKVLKKKMDPLDSPREVDEKWKKSLSAAKDVSNTVLGATVSIAEKAEKGASSVVEKNMRGSGSSRNLTLKSAARASVRVLNSASNAAENIISTTVETATDLIEHRYGGDAGSLPRQGSNSAKGSCESYDNMNCIGKKSAIKAV